MHDSQISINTQIFESIYGQHTHFKSTYIINIRNTKFLVDLMTFKQTNLKNGCMRDIRRVPDNKNQKSTNDKTKEKEEEEEEKGLNSVVLSEISNIVDDLNITILPTKNQQTLNLNLQNIVATNFANSPLSKKKCINYVNNLKKILINKEARQSIIIKAKWNDTNKIPIHKKSINNKTSKMQLSLTKQEFIKRLNEFADNENVDIIPQLMSNGNVKYLWMVTIYQAKGIHCDIAISLRLTNTIKHNKTIVPDGIYLFVDSQDVTNKWTLNLDHFKIGNIEMESKTIRDLRKKLEDYQQQVDYYKKYFSDNLSAVDNAVKQ